MALDGEMGIVLRRMAVAIQERVDASEQFDDGSRNAKHVLDREQMVIGLVAFEPPRRVPGPKEGWLFTGCQCTYKWSISNPALSTEMNQINTH